MLRTDVSRCPLSSCPLALRKAGVTALFSCGGLPESSEGGLIIALQGNLSNDSLPSECSWEVAVASLMCSFPRPYAWGVTCP